MSEDTGLDSWFLHEKLVLSLLPRQEVADVVRHLPDPTLPFARGLRAELFERALARYLSRNEVASLEVEQLHRRIVVGQLVWLEQALAFKGLGSALTAIEHDRIGRASFSGPLAADPSMRVTGTYNAERLTCGTAVEELSGKKPQFVLGYVRAITDNQVELRPIVIARRWLRPVPEIDDLHPVDPAHIWPAAVDQFARVTFNGRAKKTDLDVLKNLPEKAVKAAFADILGEPDVPNDWGGEQFDLWTGRLSVNGQWLRTAIAFKGPAAFHPMTIADLGKNGDQIDRLAQTAADLMVVQHCHAITAPVVNMLKAYARIPRDPKRYMTIDGYATIQILRHFGRII